MQQYVLDSGKIINVGVKIKKVYPQKVTEMDIIFMNPHKDTIAKTTCQIYEEFIRYDAIWIDAFARGRYTADEIYETYDKVKHKLSWQLQRGTVEAVDENREMHELMVVAKEVIDTFEDIKRDRY